MKYTVQYNVMFGLLLVQLSNLFKTTVLASVSLQGETLVKVNRLKYNFFNQFQ